MAEMSEKEIRRFLMQDTFTGKLATVKKDGSSHIVPIWFVLDGSNKNGNGDRKDGDIIFTTNGSSVNAKIHHYRQNELFRFATRIARRYMGKDNAEDYGRRNSAEGEVLVRIKAKRIIAEKDIAGWD